MGAWAVRLCNLFAIMMLLPPSLLLPLGPAAAVGGRSQLRGMSGFLHCYHNGMSSSGAVSRSQCLMSSEHRRNSHRGRGHTGGSVTLVPPPPSSSSSNSSSSPPPWTTTAASTASYTSPSSSSSSSTALVSLDQATLQAKVQVLESKLRGVEKQLTRMEGLVARKAAPGRKSLLINYDVGPDASIETGDIARGAAAAFGLLGMVVGRSLAKNLWLLGGIACGSFAAYLSREEEGGAISDTIRAVGYEVAVKARQYLFMWRTGKLSYVYFKQWQELDSKYAIMKKVEAIKALSLKKYEQAREAEKKHEVGRRVLGFAIASVHASIDGAQKLLNAKDRQELILKLPRPLRNLLTTKQQRKEARLKKYRVKWCGLREWRPFDDED